MKANANQRAVELSNMPAHAHEAGAVHHDKEDHLTGSEHTRRSKEHSATSFLATLAADRSSAKRVDTKRAEAKQRAEATRDEAQRTDAKRFKRATK